MSLTEFKPWQKFARDLVTTGEIDPTYYLIHRMKEQMGDLRQERFAMHYFLFYDLGGAAKCAYSDVDFWKYVKDGYDTFVRAPARRHFRGDKGKKAIANLSRFGDQTDVFNALYRGNYKEMYKNVTGSFAGCEIGPYFAWKLMDIFDRCLGYPIEITLNDAIKHLPDVPRKALGIYWPQGMTDGLLSVVDAIKDLPAPGNPNRVCGLPEAETILCAIYGLNHGSYHFGMDLDHRYKELKDFPDLLELLPVKQDWRMYGPTNPLVPSRASNSVFGVAN